MDLTATLTMLRRRWFSIALCTVVGATAAFALSASSPKTYQASTRLFVNIPAARGVQEALQGVQLSSNLLQSYAEIARSRTVARRASDILEGQLSPGEVSSRVSATPRPETLLIDVTARDTDPVTARDAANATATAIIEVITDLEAGREGAVEPRVIDEAVTPGAPVSPRPANDLAVGLVLGLLAGLALALVREATDRSLTTPTEAADAVGAPVLASVPRHKGANDHPLVALDGPASAGGEAYRSLRTSLRFHDDDNTVRAVVVTSPLASEGKTITAANLAVAFAAAGERVIVIDADLRKPRLSSVFGINDGETRGLTSVVFGEQSLDDALVAWRDRVRVLPSGPLPTNPSEVLGSQAMADLLAACTDRADIVLLDAPPVLPVTDAVVLSALCDGVVLVTQWGKTTGPTAEDARMTLDSVGGRVIGVVLNGIRGRKHRRYYRGYVRSDQTALVPFERKRRSA